MSHANGISSQTACSLPKYLLLFCALITALTPFLARLPAVPARGWDWFTVYWFEGGAGLLFFGALNLIPGAALYGVGKVSKRAPLAFWFAAAATVGFLLYTHGTLNLSSSSTAPIALIFIPIYAAIVAIIGWVVGFFIHLIIRHERARAWLAGIAGAAAVVWGAGTVVSESQSVVQAEARFPVVSVQKVPFEKRHVYGCCWVEALALDEFDGEPGKEIAVLGQQSVDLLRPGKYDVKSSSPHKKGCEGGVNMYPYLVPDNRGGTLIATSSGVTNIEGNCLWTLQRDGFTRLVPLRLGSSEDPTFFSYSMMDRLDRHDIAGKIVWTVKSHVLNVGTYVTANGERLPFGSTGQGIQVYDLSGQPKMQIPLPQWATSTVQELSWPSRGHLLAGAGSWVGVFDPSGKEVLRHVIQGTSFRPYHGPDGTAVRFDPKEPPYLAVASHGSSGYARSVLLIFNPKGELVWQEEMDKLRAVLTVPKGDGEALLVGGMTGLDEYSLANRPAGQTQ